MDSEKQDHPNAEHGAPTRAVEDAATLATRLERQMTVRQSLRFWPKAIMFSLIVSLAIIMEGYDTNLMSNFYPFPMFQQRFGDQVDKDGNPLISAQWQTIINNSGQAGSIVGLFINGIITE
ncbi:Alpha-glucosides permease MPH3 like protein [Verticillium longisporum]|nr:Alpha-glucosides permease MPH3 like protein [Verticillium longisporum]